MQKESYSITDLYFGKGTLIFLNRSLEHIERKMTGAVPFLEFYDPGNQSYAVYKLYFLKSDKVMILRLSRPQDSGGNPPLYVAKTVKKEDAENLDFSEFEPRFLQ